MKPAEPSTRESQVTGRVTCEVAKQKGRENSSFRAPHLSKKIAALLCPMNYLSDSLVKILLVLVLLVPVVGGRGGSGQEEPKQTQAVGRRIGFLAISFFFNLIIIIFFQAM